MDIKAKIEEIVTKLKNDPKLMAKFKSDPTGALEDLTGIKLPEDQVKQVIAGVQAKLSLDKLGSLGSLFGKK